MSDRQFEQFVKALLIVISFFYLILFFILLIFFGFEFFENGIDETKGSCGRDKCSDGSMEV